MELHCAHCAEHHTVFQPNVKDDRKSSTQSEYIPQCSILKLPHGPILTLLFPARPSKSLRRCWPWVFGCFLNIIFISLVCMILVFDCLCTSTTPELSDCQNSMSPSTWMQGLLRCFCLRICWVVASPVGGGGGEKGGSKKQKWGWGGIGTCTLCPLIFHVKMKMGKQGNNF